MEFKSTLEKALGQSKDRLKQARENGYKSPPILDEVMEIIKDSVALNATLSRSVMVSRTIQPSITNDDLKIACEMQLALASELVVNLVKEGIISINK